MYCQCEIRTNNHLTQDKRPNTKVENKNYDRRSLQ